MKIPHPSPYRTRLNLRHTETTWSSAQPSRPDKGENVDIDRIEELVRLPVSALALTQNVTQHKQLLEARGEENAHTC
jgi:hypothetical protein